MEHPPITHGLDLATHMSADAWEEFFRLVHEYAQYVRECREKKREESAASQADADTGIRLAGPTGSDSA